MNRLLNAVDKTNEMVGNVVALMIVPILVIMVMEVFLRYVFKAPTVWGTELTTFLFAGYTLLGAGYTHLKKGHVNMNALYGAVSEKNQARFNLITAIGFLLYCSVLLYESSRYFWEAFSKGQGTGSDWNPLLWPVLLCLPLGTFLLLIQGIAAFVRDVLFLTTGERE